MPASPDPVVVDRAALLELLARTSRVTREWHYIWGEARGRAGRLYSTPGWGALVGAPDGVEPLIDEHVEPADRAVVEEIRRAVERGEPWDVTYRLHGLDGVRRWARDRGVPDRSGGELRLYGAVSDVTEDAYRRETIARIAETIDEYYYTDLLRSDGTYETLFATNAVHALLGAIPEGLPIGEAWHRCVHPDDLALAGNLTERLRAGEDVSAEYRLVGFDGVTRWVAISCRVSERRSDGSVLIHGIAQDVSGRRATEDRLREITATIDEVLYTDEYLADGSVNDVFLTDGWHRLVGAAPGAAIVDWVECIHPDDRWLGHEIDAAFRRCEQVDATYRMVGVDGVTRWIRDRARGYRRGDGVIVVNGILADVTAEREAVDALAAARDEADRLARVDPLTGAYNRRHFLEELDRELERGARGGQATGLIAVDIDHFKLLNDIRGHVVGDEILQLVAARLESAIRAYDTLARWGGEEFVVLLAGLGTRDELRDAGERLRLAVEGEPFAVGGERVAITVSCGVAVGTAEETGTALLERADNALFAAKALGRNRTVLEDDVPGGPPVGEPVAVRLARVFAIAAGAREGMPENHLEDVAELSARVAGELGLSSLDAVRCRIAGWLHDVGKVALPERILLKPGPLDPEEWVVMRTHVSLGEALVLQVPELADAAPAVRHHHEQFDGSGYPDGLASDRIPIGARIVAVVDAYSAMTSARVYSAARTPQAAVAELERCSGSHFDPTVVEAFLRVLALAGIARASA